MHKNHKKEAHFVVNLHHDHDEVHRTGIAPGPSSMQSGVYSLAPAKILGVESNDVGNCIRKRD
jgi:hypothetical protein